MPSYDVRCDDCGYVEERLIKVSELDDEMDPCPECGGKVQRVILSAPVTIYKGKGWFCKDGGYDKHSKAKNGHSGPVSMKEVEKYEKTGKAGL